MALGFSKEYVHEYKLEELSKEHFIALALEAAYLSGFGDICLKSSGLVFQLSAKINSDNENFSIIFGSDVAKIISTSKHTNDSDTNNINVERFLTEFDKLRHKYTSEKLDAKFIEIKTVMETSESGNINNEALTHKDKFNVFLNLFKPREGYYITPILIVTNIVLFILMSLSGTNIFTPDSASLITWGANLKMLTLDGEWWRLLTSCFLHIGIIHLLMNMYALLYIGMLLEPLIGRKRFLSAYLLTGICSSLLSLWWHDQTISAGASGAIFGMYGMFLALLTTNLIEKEARNEMAKSIVIFVGFNLLYGMKAGIDNAGHIGGLISGIAIGFAYLVSIRQPNNKHLKHRIIAIVTACVLLITTAVYLNLPNDMAEYSKAMRRFTNNEKTSLEIHNVIQGADSKEVILLRINEKGVGSWLNNLKIIDQVDKLDLPEILKQRNVKLREYCHLRLHLMELLFKSIEDGTNNYELEIAQTNENITTLLNELNKE